MKILVLFLAFLSCCVLRAGESHREWVEKHYTKTEKMIEMRDGVTLYTAIYSPADISDENPRPVMMLRTPYGCSPYGPDNIAYIKEFKNYYDDGYIIVVQDVRGRFMSEGVFINLEERPEDTYDTVEWLVGNVPGNNGKVGVSGCSYSGYYATIAAISGHPAIKAVVPQAPVLDWYMGDDAHHNGVLMLADTYFFGRSFYRHCPNPVKSMPPVKDIVDSPIYDFFLERMTFGGITATFPEPLDFWNKMAEHPDYDAYWKAKTPSPYLRDIKPAVMIVGGSFDTDDCYGAVRTYRTIRKNSPSTELYFVYGPWFHCRWRSDEFYLDEIDFPFFDHYLDGGEKFRKQVTIIPSVHSRGDSAEPLYTCDGMKTDCYDSYRVEDLSGLRLFLHPDSLLSEDKPSGKGSFRYTSNPFHPVPYYDGEGKSGQNYKRDKRYMLADQRFASSRDDVLSFSTRPVRDTLKLLGPIDVELFVSASSGDADFVVKAIDVAPDGYQMLLRWDVMRARYRKGFEKPVPLRPGKVEHIGFSMSDIAHYLLPGHRLMVQIQSSLFPVIDLNPGKYVDNIYKASVEDFVKSEIAVHYGSGHSSNVTFRIVD